MMNLIGTIFQKISKRQLQSWDTLRSKYRCEVSRCIVSFPVCSQWRFSFDRLWENDQEPDSGDKSWNRLTENEKRAAVLLGFNQKKWDEDSATDKSSNDKYNHISWKDLPANVRKAAKQLGYNKTLWNDDKEPPLESKDWTELTSKQQEAARVLGYDQRRWDGDSVAIPSYDDMDWEELPQDARAAAICLQYKEDIWDNDGQSPLDDLDWCELTAKQQEAAGVLGYNQTTWDDDDSIISDEDNFSVAEDSFLSFQWDDLPPRARNAAKTLGYQRSNWPRTEDVPIHKKAWAGLSVPEKEAAQILGFNQRGWDGETIIDFSNLHDNLSEEAHRMDTVSTSPVEKLQNDFSSIFGFRFGSKSEDNAPDDPTPCQFDEDGFWKDLPQRAREAAEVLGYTEELWNKDGEPPSNDKYWDELSPKEQRAATVLGYSKDKWNDGSSSSSSSSSSS
jgi:hypothetical protein